MNTPLELTDWLPGSTPPAHVGVYERRNSDGPFSCWHGAGWNQDAATPTDAASQTLPSRDQNASWRGLVEPSTQPCATCSGHTVIDRGYDVDSDRDLIDECADC